MNRSHLSPHSERYNIADATPLGAEDRDDRVTNAMQFFNAYLKGAFIPFRQDVIIISAPGRYKVWEYEDSMGGELELLSRLLDRGYYCCCFRDIRDATHVA